ncbi:Chloramphenicol-sensitive protein rarD [Microbacterium esteraromaticum]|uniref:Chloramphenicol-sensitive protein rarD n=1 Tax=Microbacterium esteraromaticum TaxID=57043 RepID=A0A1R4JAR2_9MICO|nr:EamA family transporter RarD [Microbacterium esteraromaticum]SJN28803.1 Chloramphenicol-sensitive protein rarD [Microbacterium esteraromaticum]
MNAKQSSPRGVLVSVLASVLFGLIFFLAGVLSSSAEVVFAWRILITFACYALALSHPLAREQLRLLGRRLRSRWWMSFLLVGLAAIIGFQLWLFMWAPMHGHALDTSLGYLLLPICLVLGGRFVLKAPVSRMQWAVVALATVAIAVKLAATPQLSWVTLAICLPYTVYFVVRQRFGLDGPIVFGAESLLMLPVAVAFLLAATPGVIAPAELAGLAGIGIASAAAMSLYLAAAALLPLPVFGLLSYVEPVLLVGIALLLGERMQGADGWVYLILAVALTVLAVEGFRVSRRARRARPELPPPSVPGAPGIGEPDVDRRD